MSNLDRYQAIHVSRLNHLFHTVANLSLPPESRILDIGCYPPLVINHLRQKYSQVFGISSPHELFTAANVNQLDIQIQPLPYQKNYFDLVIFTEILEHLYQTPAFPLTEVFRVLKPGGYLLLTSPNVFRFQNLINLLFFKNIYFPISQFIEPQNARHCREYSSSEISGLLQKFGFKIIKNSYFIAYPPFRPKNSLDSIFLKIIKYLNYFLMLLFHGRRDTILILAQK